MTEIKTYCDHCGKLLDEMVDYNEITVEAAHKFIRPDLCCDCFEKLWDMISEFCAEMKDEKAATMLSAKNANTLCSPIATANAEKGTRVSYSLPIVAARGRERKMRGNE